MIRYITLSLLLLFSSFSSFAQQQLNMSLLSNWSDNSIPPAFYGPYNDVWGYVDGAGREYAILGSSIGTHFIDVTDGSNPVQISFQPSNDQNTLAIHRDYKTYQHYCYAVADEGQNTLQIFDLQYLPDSVVKVYDSNVFTKRCHNLFIENDKLYLASNTVGNNNHSMDVLSLANPESPTFLSTLFNPNFNVVHDVFVRNDTAYCSVGYDGFYVYSFVNPVSPQMLMSITAYPEQGYNHSSWIAPNTFNLVMADENHGLGLKLIDISDFSNPVVKSIFRSNLLNVPFPASPDGSIPHNEFIVGNYLFVSYYHDGVQVFDISDPLNPIQFAYYDTYPQNTDYIGYAGCWGVYPFLPSGKILASDMSNGLFVLDGSAITGLNPVAGEAVAIQVYPNPFSDKVNLKIPSGLNQNIQVSILDVTGREVYSRNYMPSMTAETLSIPCEKLSAGVYSISCNWGTERVVKKIVKSTSAQ